MDDRNQSQDVVAIVLNWNGRAVLNECVRSLRTQTYMALRILVVDNGSTDGSAIEVSQQFPTVDILRLDKNKGFGAGNNAGIRFSAEPFILIVNNDTVLDSNCVSRLVAAMQQDTRIGSVATKIVLFEHPDRIDAAGITVCPDGMAIGRGRMEGLKDYQNHEDVFFASDCCCLFRRTMLEQTGLYDEDFFAYGEVTDLGWRARRTGWRSVFVPEAIVVHHHSRSSGSHSPFKALLVERNRIWVAIKNFPVPLLLAGLVFTCLRYYWQAFGALTGRGRAGAFTAEYSAGALFAILVKAYFQAAFKLPRMLSHRLRIRRLGSLTSADCRKCIQAYGISAHDLALKN